MIVKINDRESGVYIIFKSMDVLVIIICNVFKHGSNYDSKGIKREGIILEYFRSEGLLYSWSYKCVKSTFY